MMTVIGFLLFGAAVVMAAHVVASTLVPAMPRILELLAGEHVAEPVIVAARPRRVITHRRASMAPAMMRREAA